MRHQKKNKKLNKPTDQRLSLLKNLSYSLIEKKKLITTDARAKELKKFIEKLVTIAKTDTFTSRRKVFRIVNNKIFVQNLFNTATKYNNTNGKNSY